MELRLHAIEGLLVRCVLCHDDLDDGPGRWCCDRCLALAHPECATEIGCPTLGCPGRSPSRARISLVLPATRATAEWRALRWFMIATTVVMLLILSLVVVFAEGSAIAPFMHSIF